MRRTRPKLQSIFNDDGEEHEEYSSLSDGLSNEWQLHLFCPRSNASSFGLRWTMVLTNDEMSIWQTRDNDLDVNLFNRERKDDVGQFTFIELISNDAKRIISSAITVWVISIRCSAISEFIYSWRNSSPRMINDQYSFCMRSRAKVRQGCLSLVRTKKSWREKIQRVFGLIRKVVSMSVDQIKGSSPA